jgi:tetratricopeptide (TPR) repeat protein
MPYLADKHRSSGRMRLPIIALCIAFPVAALAVDTDKPPEPTPTTTVCTGGKVWDHDEGACVDVREGRLGDDALYAAAREFAYAGQYAHAIAALEAMKDRRSDRVLTYMGFTLRKSGDPARGMGYYTAALTRNPDNLLARSYMGQGMAELGYLEGAHVQLAQIRARGGAGTWPELALLSAIRAAEAVRG